MEEGGVVEPSSSNKLGMWREFQAVFTTFFGVILVGVTMGYSSVAISDIQRELTTNDTVVIPAIDATIEELSWFGKFKEACLL